VGLFKKQAPGVLTAEMTELNGWPGVIVRLDGHPYSVIQLETDGEKVFAVRSVLNPDKIGRL
jgi:RNA polymerase sigma-70 factor (ECF subfamily)